MQPAVYVPSLLVLLIAVFVAMLVIARSAQAVAASGWSMLVLGAGLLVSRLVVRPSGAGPAWALPSEYLKANMLLSGLLLGGCGLVLLHVAHSRRNQWF
jgi:hypothetical protein